MDSNNVLISSGDIDWLHDEFIFFGNPDADNWFLGLEEGDHPEEDQPIDEFIHGLMRKTKMHSDSQVTSLRQLCAPSEGYKFLPLVEENMPNSSKGVVFQSTWGGYIKLLLSINFAKTGNDWTLDDVKIYQKYRLGEIELQDDALSSCLLELFPMARKGRKGAQWPYAKLANREDLQYFSKAKNYKIQVEAMRTKKLLQYVKRYKPKYLFSFGKDCKDAICAELQKEPELHHIDTGKRELPVSHLLCGETDIVFSNHPTSHGVSDEYWRNLGKKVIEL